MTGIKNHNKKIFIKHADIFVCLFLIAATFFVYYQVRHHDFVKLDDNQYITDNCHVKDGITTAGIKWAFTTTLAGNWHPLTWLSHMLDCQFFGMKPGQHHLTSLLFHIINSLLFFFVFRKMTGNVWPSAFIAALFALHPLHVESVAWVSERKDVLSTFFLMLTMLSYIGYVRRPAVFRYLMVMLFFTLGLMSKPMLVTLPFVLLLLDYWPFGRLRFHRSSGSGFQTNSKITHLIWEKIPLFILAAISCIVAIHAQRHAGAVASLDIIPFHVRIANALVAYVSYMEKMISPVNLSVMYPHPGMLPWWKTTGACLLLLFISYLAIRKIKQRPYFIVGWLWYLGTLVPVIGLVQVGTQSMADRYTYIPLVGLFMIIAWGVPDLLKQWRYKKICFVTSAIVLFSMVITWKQAGHWKNTFTLFTHALNVTSDNYLAHNNLGNELSRQGDIKEAINHYVKALKINPDYDKAHYNLGLAMEKQGRAEEAIAHYTQALRVNPGLSEAHLKLGVALKKQGRVEDAIHHYLQALKLNPDDEQAHNNLGTALSRQGRIKDAIYHYLQALKINPDNEKAHYNTGKALAKSGQTKDAVHHYLQALGIDPDLYEAHYNLAVILQKQERTDEAINHYQQAVRIKPDFEKAHFNLGVALFHKGDVDGAIERFKEAIRLKPDFVKAERLLEKALMVKHTK